MNCIRENPLIRFISVPISEVSFYTDETDYTDYRGLNWLMNCIRENPPIRFISVPISEVSFYTDETDYTDYRGLNWLMNCIRENPPIRFICVPFSEVSFYTAYYSIKNPEAVSDCPNPIHNHECETNLREFRALQSFVLNNN